MEDDPAYSESGDLAKPNLAPARGSPLGDVIVPNKGSPIDRRHTVWCSKPGANSSPLARARSRLAWSWTHGSN
jgi:hypothetical protein